MRLGAVRVDRDGLLVGLDRVLVLAEVPLRLAQMEERRLHPLVQADGPLEGADGLEVLLVLEVVKAERVVHARHVRLQADGVTERLGGLLRPFQRAVGLAEVREGERVAVVELGRVLQHLDRLAVPFELRQRLALAVERVDLVAADLQRLLERVERLLVALEAVERLRPAPVGQRVVLAARGGLGVGGGGVLIELQDLLLLAHREPHGRQLAVDVERGLVAADGVDRLSAFGERLAERDQHVGSLGLELVGALERIAGGGPLFDRAPAEAEAVAAARRRGGRTSRRACRARPARACSPQAA